jgi:hypothetical protein
LFPGKDHPDVAESLKDVGEGYQILEGEANLLVALEFFQ